MASALTQLRTASSAARVNRLSWYITQGVRTCLGVADVTLGKRRVLGHDYEGYWQAAGKVRLARSQLAPGSSVDGATKTAALAAKRSRSSRVWARPEFCRRDKSGEAHATACLGPVRALLRCHQAPCGGPQRVRSCRMAVASLTGVKEGAQRRERFQRAFLGEVMASVESLSADVGGVTAPYLDRVI